MSNTLPENITTLKKVRIKIPKTVECNAYTIEDIFDILEKNNGLTEEFIYNYTNPLLEQLPVYSASYEPIGYLPKNTKKDGDDLKICKGEVIIIFRQGYAGQMYIPKEIEIFASEHTIPIKVKDVYSDKINQYWFVKYYEPEVFHYVTGKADSRNFSEMALIKVPLLIPPKDWQDECAQLYKDMDNKIYELEKAISEMHI